MSDLFTKLLKLSNARENTLAECLAATLKENPDFCRKFLTVLCGEKVDSVPISTAKIEIKTQQSGPNSRIDMEIILNKRKKIGIENKLDSPEGKGQLLKYLDLPIDRLAFITREYVNVNERVKRARRYLKPNGKRAHFLWSDFYRKLESSARKYPNCSFTQALFNLFDRLGFRPPTEIGDLNNNTEAAKKFLKYWDLTSEWLKKIGWDSSVAMSKAGQWCWDESSKTIESVWLDPVVVPGVLRARIYFKKRQNYYIAKAKKFLQSRRFQYYDDVDIIDSVGKIKGKVKPVLEVSIPTHRLFDAHPKPEQIRKRLARFSRGIIVYINRIK